MWRYKMIGRGDLMISYGFVEYEVMEERLYSSELGSYVSYGIIGRDRSGKNVAVCSDISPDRSFVAELCEKCNALGLSPMHLLDVVCDSM